MTLFEDCFGDLPVEEQEKIAKLVTGINKTIGGFLNTQDATYKKVQRLK